MDFNSLFLADLRSVGLELVLNFFSVVEFLLEDEGGLAAGGFYEEEKAEAALD